MKVKFHHHPLRWLIWSLAVAFYFYEFFLRVSPSVMVPNLMEAFSVNATAIGLLSGFYFYIYAPMQLPVGILTDRYGARRLLALAACAAGLGTLLFGIATDYWTASFGRILMGAGSAFGFIGLIYICSHWFPLKQRNLLIGVANGFGMIGAIAGEGPLRIGIDVFGWRATLFVLAIMGLVLSGLIYLIVRNDPPHLKKHPPKRKGEPIWKNLRIVTRNGYSWLNAIQSMFLYSTTPAFAGLWGIPFIHTSYGISTKLAGFAISSIYVGWLFGGPFIGRLSDKLEAKKSLLVISSFLGAVFMSIVVFVRDMPLPLLFMVLFCVGLANSAQLLTYSYAIDLNPHKAKGSAAAFTNFICFLGAAAMQSLIGFLLDLNWSGILTHGIRIYTLSDYTTAMILFPLSFVIAGVLALFLKHVPPNVK